MAQKEDKQVAIDAEMNARVTLFDKEFQTLQAKYNLRLGAQVILPGGAVLTVPIQAFPTGPMTKQENSEEASKPE